MDEYLSEFYEVAYEETYGFKFEYGEELSESIPMSKEEVKKIDKLYVNRDESVPLVVKCTSCGKFMTYDSVYEIWICRNCNKKVKAMEVYEQLDKENLENDYEDYWE
ncbi:MAG: hypothetical protein J6Y02_01005 [Pseudobutyrivibrio sp.]|nr:hypothetical protein [Pseudobutyrivibrio sp.]